MEHYSDDDLAALVKNGDSEAFDLIIERYYGRLFNFLLRILRNREDAEDALQSVFLKTAAAVKKYKGEGKFKSWIFTIASNEAISKIRERKKMKIMPGFSYSSEEEGNRNPVDYLPDVREDPAGTAERNEMAVLLEQAIDSLPFNQKQVFVMRHVSELSFKEISEALNIPLNTALGRMHYAVKKIEESLKNSYSRRRPA